MSNEIHAFHDFHNNNSFDSICRCCGLKASDAMDRMIELETGLVMVRNSGHVAMASTSFKLELKECLIKEIVPGRQVQEVQVIIQKKIIKTISVSL